MSKPIMIGFAFLFVIFAIILLVVYIKCSTKIKQAENELKRAKEEYEAELQIMKELDKKKDELKAEYDEKKSELNTGNSYNNNINMANELQKLSEKRKSSK